MATGKMKSLGISPAKVAFQMNSAAENSSAPRRAGHGVCPCG